MIEDFLKKKIGDITGFDVFFRFGARLWFRFNLITGEHELINRPDHWGEANDFAIRYYKYRFLIDPPIRIIGDSKILMPNFEYDTERKKYKITLYDCEEIDFTIYDLFEHLCRRIRRRVFVPVQYCQFIMNFGNHHVIAEILETQRWFQIVCDNDMIPNMLEYYRIRETPPNVQIVDGSMITGETCDDILEFINQVNAKHYNIVDIDIPNNGLTFSIEDDNIIINGEKFEIRKGRMSKFYVRGFDENTSRKIAEFFKQQYPDKRTTGVFPEFKTREDLIDFILKLKDDSNIFENIPQITCL